MKPKHNSVSEGLAAWTELIQGKSIDWWNRNLEPITVATYKPFKKDDIIYYDQALLLSTDGTGGDSESYLGSLSQLNKLLLFTNFTPIHAHNTSPLTLPAKYTYDIYEGNSPENEDYKSFHSGFDFSNDIILSKRLFRVNQIDRPFLINWSEFPFNNK